MVKAVVGANWGDEGKGKITDMLADSADLPIPLAAGMDAVEDAVQIRRAKIMVNGFHLLPQSFLYRIL